MTSTVKCMMQAYGRIGSALKTLNVLNLTDAIGNEHPQIVFQVGVDRKENYAGGYCLPVSYF